MNTRPTDHDTLINRALQDLDAAPPAMLTQQQQRRADDTLEDILESGATAEVGPARGATPSRAPRRLGGGILLVAAALALTLVISVSGILGGGTAYASWTASPTPRPTAEHEKMAEQCRDYLADSAEAGPPIEGIPTAADLRGSALVLADSRGDWTYVVLEGAEGLEATCLIEDGGGFLPAPFGGGTAAGTYGFMTDLPTPGPREIIGTGLMGSSADEGAYFSTEGYVGRDVAGVTVVGMDGTRVEATIVGDRFAAWWPDSEAAMAATAPSATYLVTLKDGTQLPPTDYDGIGPHWEE